MASHLLCLEGQGNSLDFRLHGGQGQSTQEGRVGFQKEPQATSHGSGSRQVHHSHAHTNP